MCKRWRENREEGREEKKQRGIKQSSERSMSILPPHPFISAISFNPTPSLSLSSFSSLPCPFLLSLFFFHSSSRSVPLHPCLYLSFISHPSLLKSLPCPPSVAVVHLLSASVFLSSSLHHPFISCFSLPFFP